MAQTVKRLPTMRETRVRSLGWEDPMEKEMAIHSSTIAWKIPWTEEPGRLQSMGSQRVGHDWGTSLHLTLSLFFSPVKWRSYSVFKLTSLYYMLVFMFTWQRCFLTWYLLLACVIFCYFLFCFPYFIFMKTLQFMNGLGVIVWTGICWKCILS